MWAFIFNYYIIGLKAFQTEQCLWRRARRGTDGGWGANRHDLGVIILGIHIINIQKDKCNNENSCPEWKDLRLAKTGSSPENL